VWLDACCSFGNNKWQFNGYGGESYEQAHKRAQTWLDTKL